MAPLRIVQKTSTVLIRVAVLLCMLAAGAVVYARLDGYELMSVESDSMKPMTRKGDAVLLNTRDTDPRIGDVISYVSAENPTVVITHRVIGVDNKQGIIAAKGDNTPRIDQPVAAWNVTGTVTRVIPVLGIALNAVKHPLGLLAVIYLPASGIIIAEIRRLSAYYATGISRRKTVHYRLNYHRR